MNKLRLEYLDPADLDENPANWRTHPNHQLQSLTDVIDEVGWARACLYNERTKRLIDGHARKKIAKGPVPVLIGDWSEDQERLILATLDPLAGLAGIDQPALDQLLLGLDPASESLQTMLGGMSSSSLDDGTEFDETAADEVKMIECPHCGKDFPR